MTISNEELAQAIREAYIEGLNQGRHQALMEEYGCGISKPANELAELYTQTFFVKQTLADGKKFLRR